MFKKTIIAIAMLTALNISYATQYRCEGMSTLEKHKEYKVLIDTDKSKFIVNGDIFDIKPKIKLLPEIKSLVSNDFVSDKGTYVHSEISVFVKGKYKGRVFLTQYNAVTEAMNSMPIDLMCDKSIVL